MVAGKCQCGCPTVYFETEGKPVSRRGEEIVSDFMARVNDVDYGVMLFVNEGHLSSLEVYACAGHDKPFDLPPISSLYPFDGASKLNQR